MLPKLFREASIYTYDWDADYLHDAPVKSLASHAETFLGLISVHQRRRRQLGRRPIIFIASCFGGLVLSEVRLPTY
jgi:hypothetical protein